MQNSKKLSLTTVWSYAFSYGSGYQIMGALVGSYLMIFLTDTFGVPAAAVSVIMVLASVWDAINDPIMGVLADKTHTRFGKYRPYFLFVPAALTVVAVALFANPSLSTHGKIIWTAVFYVFYGMLRTAIEIPCGAIISAVTDEASERSRMISAYTLVMGIFTTITTSFALTAVSLFGGDNVAKGYMIIMLIAGILMTISCWICFANTKETCVPAKKTSSAKEDLKNLFSTKGIIPVLLIWVGSYIAYNGMMSSSVYYVMYCLMRPDLISPYMLTISVVGLLGIALGLPVLMRFTHEVKRAFAVSQILVLLSSVVCLVFGNNIPVIFISSGIGSFFATMSMAFSAMIMTEMTDYVYKCKGSVVNGTMASLKGFSNKIGMAIANGLTSAVLAATGYIAGAVGGQSAATLTGISMVRFLCPAVMAVLIVVSFKFYPGCESENSKSNESLSKGELSA